MGTQMNLQRFEDELNWVMQKLDESDYSAKTLKDYRLILTRINAEIPGGLLQPSTSARPALERWRSDLQRLLRLPESDSRRISQSKVTCDVAALRTFYRTLVSRNKYDADPTEHMAGGGRKKGLPRPMPHIEFSKLCLVMDQTTTEGLRDRTMVELAYHGLRNFEVCGLKLGQVTYLSDSKVFQLRVQGKGDKERLAWVSNDASAFLFARYILAAFASGKSLSDWTQPENSEEVYESIVIRAAGAALDYLVHAELRGEESLFKTATGLAPDNNWFCKMFRRYRKKAGLSNEWGPHSLRHSCGTDLLSACGDLRLVQQVLGHEDIRSTVIYTHVVPNSMVAVMKHLNTPAAATPQPEPQLAEVT
jgi:integrase/recombinase XerD